MHTGQTEGTRRVWLGLALASAATAAWWSLMRSELPVRTGTAAKPAQPLVRLAKAGGVSGDEVLREKSELMDPTPLFFPTKWNYGQRPLQEGRLKQPGQVFGSFEPKLTVGEQNIANYGAEATPVPEKLVDVLVQGNEAPFAGMGQIDAQRSTLTVRAGYLEVREQKNGNIITAQQLSGIVIPRSDFAPVEFLVLVGTAGLIGEPVLTNGSGWDEVDIFFRTYLVKSYRLGERLPPGQYRVSVGA